MTETVVRRGLAETTPREMEEKWQQREEERRLSSLGQGILLRNSPGCPISLQADAEARETDITLQKGLLGSEGCALKKEVGDLLESYPPWNGCAL